MVFSAGKVRYAGTLELATCLRHTAAVIEQFNGKELGGQMLNVEETEPSRGCVCGYDLEGARTRSTEELELYALGTTSWWDSYRRFK